MQICATRIPDVTWFEKYLFSNSTRIWSNGDRRWVTRGIPSNADEKAKIMADAQTTFLLFIDHAYVAYMLLQRNNFCNLNVLSRMKR